MSAKGIDYSKLSIEDALKDLGSNFGGLSTVEVNKRLETYHYNEIKEKKENPIKKFLLYFYGPMPIAIEAAAIVSAIINHWDDFALIVLLLLTNVLVTFWQERSAGNAIKQLMGKLALRTRVLRDGKWQTTDAINLVPGDIIRLRMGDVIPADGKLVDGAFLSVDQSALTGESLPKEAHLGDSVFSASVVKQGEMSAVVTGTGENTFFGRTTHLVATASNVTGLSKIISKIVYFLVGIALILGGFVFYYGIYLGFPVLSDLLFFLILLVASIPIALPVVLTVTMALGALSLAEKKAIVTRLVSIEELASMDVLCSDKTGTLTKNSLTVGSVTTFGKFSLDDVMLYAALASLREDADAIDQAVFAALKGKSDEGYVRKEFVPFDPAIKRTEATVSGNGENFMVMKGEPNTILSLCKTDQNDLITAKVREYAEKGYRVIAVAKNSGDAWQFAGLIPLFDPLREDSKETILRAEQMGVEVKMITGDNEAIASEIGRELGLKSKVLTCKDIKDAVESGKWEEIEEAGTFAGVYPEDKYLVVKGMEMKGHTIGMTGDGVNDAPALKEAQVGIAVQGATDAARAAADIVLTDSGLSTIITAVEEGRRIFQRMQSYVLYRVTETLRILVFVTVAIVIWHFYPISALLLIVLALLNDLPIIAVSTDNVLFHNTPERWRMKYIGGLPALLGGVGALETLLLIYIGLSILHMGIPEILSLVFLKLVVSGHLTMFVTRSEKAFWKVKPSITLFIALISTMVVGYFITAYGLLVVPIGNLIALLVIAYAFVWFLVEDGLRLLYDRVNSFGI
ncbi:MAG: plasma-membrane proton-efflux P-type ATPase [Thermoplasmata archaeon]|nr:plasma-membrane proton-efflux P-type ATPase [Candidatus Sysuiplasma jiujiangense]